MPSVVLDMLAPSTPSPILGTSVLFDVGINLRNSRFFSSSVIAGSLIALFGVGTSVAVGQVLDPKLVGRWAHLSNMEACKEVHDGEPGSPLTISNKSVSGNEWSCEVKSWKKSGLFYYVRGTCFGEGSEFAPADGYALDVDGRLVIIDTENISVFERCPEN